jgi:hypothetical protein
VGRREHSALVSHLYIHLVGVFLTSRIKTEILQLERSRHCLYFLGILHRRLLCWSATICCLLSSPGNRRIRSEPAQRSCVRLKNHVAMGRVGRPLVGRRNDEQGRLARVT